MEDDTVNEEPKPAPAPPKGVPALALKSYYDQFFPFELFARWLSYGTLKSVDSQNLLPLREWSFTLEVNGEEIYQRYQSFDSYEPLKKAVVESCPSKIDIGAICNVFPRDHKKVRDFKFVTREFIIDIDMTDYDDVRTCCSEAKVCPKCWKLLDIAMEIITKALTEDFGFQHIMWIFSGRRGVHCWVCDESARRMSDEQRAAVADYLSVANRDTVTFPLHPALSRAFAVLENRFEEIVIEDQGMFDTWENYERVLSNVYDEGVRTRMEQLWTGKSIGKKLWKDVSQLFEKELKLLKNDQYWKLKKVQQWIYFRQLYPRLDVNVSTHINHLLKAPFCVHPKTGLVCVPIPLSEIGNFLPTDAPTVNEIVTALNNGEKNGGAKFARAIRSFETFVKTVEAVARKELIAKQEQQGQW